MVIGCQHPKQRVSKDTGHRIARRQQWDRTVSDFQASTTSDDNMSSTERITNSLRLQVLDTLPCKVMLFRLPNQTRPSKAVSSMTGLVLIGSRLGFYPLCCQDHETVIPPGGRIYPRIDQRPDKRPLPNEYGSAT